MSSGLKKINFESVKQLQKILKRAFLHGRQGSATRKFLFLKIGILFFLRTHCECPKIVYLTAQIVNFKAKFAVVSISARRKKMILIIRFMGEKRLRALGRACIIGILLI